MDEIKKLQDDVAEIKAEITFALQEIAETFQAQDELNRVFLKAITELRKAVQDIKASKETLK